MKKLSIVLLAVLLIASLIISCDNSTKALTDELVEVQLGTQAGSRALSFSVTLEQISDSSLTWYYSATKKSQENFQTGATTGEEIVLGTTKTFSQGKWDFELWAMKGVVKDDEGVTNPGTKVYYGKLKDVLITKSSSPVPVVVNVSPYVENENGTLVFDDVKIKAATSTPQTLVTVVPNTVKIGTNNYTLDANGDNEGISLAPGQYDVLVAFIGSDGATYASETITITIYSNRVTTLTGMVDEETASAEITVIGTAATVSQDVSAGDVEIMAPVNPAGAVSIDQSGAVKANDTVVSLPAGSLTLSTAEGTTNTAVLKVDTTSIENSNFSVGAGETNLTSVAGLDITLKVNDTDVKTFNNDKKATVTTYIARNLTNVEVRYNKADGSIEKFTVETTTSDTDITIPEGKAGVYYSKTGKLVFQTSHFSEYYVVANKFKVLNATQSKVYDDLSASIADSNDGDTIKLFEDVVLESSITINGGKKLTIDLNGNNVSCSCLPFIIYNAKVNFVGDGIIYESSDDQYGAIRVAGSSDDVSNYTVVSIGKDVTLRGWSGIFIGKDVDDGYNNYGIVINLEGAAINPGADGHNTAGYGIYINGSNTNSTGNVPVININGATIDSRGAGIYAAGYAKWNISGRTTNIKGVETAIEIRAGELTIEDGSFTATAGGFSCDPNGSGTTTSGAAIAIAQHTTKKDISVEINGGTFNGVKALNESNPQDNDPAPRVSLSVTGGTFNGVVSAVDASGFITGGRFSSNPTGYVANGYIAELQSSGKYKVNNLTNWIQLADTSWYCDHKNCTHTEDEKKRTYIINNAEQLAGLAKLVNSGTSFNGKTVTLGESIDLERLNWTPIGKAGKSFQGIFDGDNQTISNLTINTPYTSDVGLFGLTTNGEIKNLIVENAEITGYLDVGVVAGTPYTSKYTNISVTGCVKVKGYAYVGGAFGKNLYANATDIRVDCTSDSYVKADSKLYRTYVGGIVGFMGEGSITVTNANSNIDVYGSTCDVGGITGIAHYNNTFINCSSSGNVYITSYNDDGDQLEIGGIAGVWHNENGTTVTLTNCSFTGNLSATHSNGTVYQDGFANKGLVGRQYSTSGTGRLIINNDNT